MKDLLPDGFVVTAAWAFTQSMRRKINMTEIHLNGLVFVFYSNDELIEWMDAYADEVREEE